MIMKDFYKKKLQTEKKGTPFAVFRAKRVGMSETFERLNKQRNNTLVREFTYPVYYNFNDDDIPGIHSKIISTLESQLGKNNGLGFSLGTDVVFSKFSIFGESEIDHITDYEYDITYELIPQPEKKKDFSSIKKVTFEGDKS